jgi:uncharacterized protein
LETVESFAGDERVACPNCKTALNSSYRFCGNCGKEAFVANNLHADSFEYLKPALVFYACTLVLLAVYKFTSSFPEGFEGLLYVTILDVMIMVPFFVLYRDRLINVLFNVRINVWVMGAVLGCAMIGAVIVTYLASFINGSLFDVIYAPYIFEDTNSPILWTVVFTCLMPAIFEELTFRGFLFDSMKDVTTEQGAMYITSFVFGVIHLSFISLIWLVPMGLGLGWLRMKYQTLWYGIVGHFVYNFLVSVPDLL